MCFGNETQDKSTSTTQLPAWVTGAGQNNLTYAQSIRDRGFQPFQGNPVADFSGQQKQSFGFGNELMNGISPYLPNTGSWLSAYATSGPGSIAPETIASRMSPYMNAYVKEALTPQLSMLQDQFNTQNKGFDAAATGSGAFGDSGWGFGRTNLTKAQDEARTGVIGNAYNQAFNTAIGAGAQDVATNLNAQMKNMDLREQALARMFGGANALWGQGVQGTNLTNQLGAQQTAQDQAGKNFQIQEWLMRNNFDPQMIQLLNQTLGASAATAPKTTENIQYGKDNSGWGMLGSLAGTLLGGPVGGAIGGWAGNMLSGGMGGGGSMMPNSNQGGWNPNVPGGYNYGGFSFAADGGNIPGNAPTVVGERGPEVFVPNVSGLVIPTEILQAAIEKRQKQKAKPPERQRSAIPHGNLARLAAQLGAAA